jgi:protein-S-isoprenylcysteine O-methyltransferase Ste14
MAMIEEFDRSGNWLFRWRSFLPLVLYVLAAVVITSGWDDHMDHTSQNWMIFCLAVALLGQVIRAITIGHTPAGTSGRNTKQGQVADELNTSGIYSVCRHPLYLGNYFMWLGIILYVGNWWFSISCTLLFWLYYERIMFAEEHFLRGKFGQRYLNWAEKVPPFIPRLLKWSGGGSTFSMKNVLKREYNGFFAIFLSFSLVDVLKNYIVFETFDMDLIQPFWLYGLIGSFMVFIVLRTLKKMTKVLNVKGR